MHTRIYTLAAMLAAFIMLAAGCGNTGGSAYRKPSNDELRKFAVFIDSLAVAGNLQELDSYIDVEELTNRCVKNMGANFITKKSLQQGIDQGMKEGDGIFKTMAGQIKKLHFLKIYEKDNEAKILFRIEAANAGINYIDLTVSKKDGGCKIADFYSFAAADNISGLMGGLFLQNIPMNELGFEKGNGDEGKAMMEVMKQMKEDQNNGDYAGVIKKYHSLSEENKKQKLFLLIYVSAAINVSTEEYKKALNVFRGYYPNEPGLALMMIDMYYMQEDYAGSLQAVNQVDSAVGGDVYLDLYRGNLYFPMGDTANSLSAYKRFNKKYPGNKDVCTSLLYINSELKNYDAAVQVMKDYRSANGYNPIDSLDLKSFIYVPLRYSDEYREYAKTIN